MASVLYSNPVMGTKIETGDKLYFYQAGTSTLLTVYTDEALTAPAPSPIAANADGRFVALFFASADGDAKVVLESTFDVEKWTVDNYPVNDLSGIESQSNQNTSDITALEQRTAIAEGDINDLESTLGGVSDTLYTAKDDNPLELVGTEFAVKDGYGGAPSAVLVDYYSAGGTALPENAWTTMPLQTFISNRCGASVANNKITLPTGTYYIEYELPMRNAGDGTDFFMKLEDTAGTSYGGSVAVYISSFAGYTTLGMAQVIGGTYEILARSADRSGSEITYRPLRYGTIAEAGQKMAASMKVWKISDF